MSLRLRIVHPSQISSNNPVLFSLFVKVTVLKSSFVISAGAVRSCCFRPTPGFSLSKLRMMRSNDDAWLEALVEWTAFHSPNRILHGEKKHVMQEVIERTCR